MYKKLRFLTTLLLLAVSVGAWAETEEIFSVSCSNSDAPEGWSVHVEYANGYWQVSAGGNAYIITSSYDLSSYKSVEINAEIANYGSGNGNAKAKYEISYDGGETFTETGTAGSPTSSTYVSANYTLKSVSSRVVIKVTNNLTSGRVMRFKNFKLIGTKKEIGADPYTVTFSDGGSVTETAGGAGVTLPSRNAIGEYTFAGWSEINVETETTTAPTIIPVGTYHPTANITLYPVYTRTEGGSAQNNTASVTIADYASANNWVSGSNSGPQYTEVILNSDVKATTTGTGNNGKYYSDWRFYQSGNGNVIISTTNGTLKSVKFTFSNSNGGTLNYNNSAVTSGTAVNVSGTSAEFTVGNSGTATNGQIRITVIEVIYTIGNSTTYYWSAPVAAAVERPVIDVPETFTFSTIATISCDTEDASIKYSFDNETWSDYSEPLTITETTTIYAKGVKGTEESVVVSKSTTKQLATPTVTINATGITNTNVYDGTDAGTLAATVAYNDNAIADAIVTWSGNNNEVATIDAETGIVTLVAAGTVTFTATYVGNSDYAQATATYEMTVTNTDPNAPGTQNNPYTVAQARAAIDAGAGVTSVYATGIVSEIVTAYNSQYGNISYNISTDGTTTADQLQAYRGKSYNGENFTSADDIQVGDVVVIHGNLKKYNETYEFDANSQLVSLQRPVITTPSISLSETTINATADGAEGTINVTYNNITDVAAEVVFYEEDGETPATYDWVTAEIDDNNNLYYLSEANEGAARTAYMKVWAYDDDLKEVYSDLITITQAAPVIDYATLPFSWEGGAKADFLALNGVTSHGLGSDYAASNAPYRIKLDNTGDYIQVKTDSQPGKVTIGVKMIGGADDSKITVQGSADGETFTDVEELTISGAQNDEITLETTKSFAATDRYVRLLFTKGSNVGVGPIKIAQYVEPSHNPVIISDAGMATLSSNKALDFTNVTTIEAYYATLDNSGNVAYHRIRKVPAETGLLVRNAAGEAQGAVSADVPTLTETAESVEGNILVAALDAITGLQNESDGYKNYILNKHSQYGLGFYLANGNNLAANRAYMRIPVQTAREFIGINFDGDATGIESIRLNGADDAIFDLQGRKVMNPAKGLYIVNGKKVVVK